MKSKLKVLLVDCNSILASEQKKCTALAQYPDLELTLLVPNAYRERRRLVPLEKSTDPQYQIAVAKLWGKVPNRTFFLNGLYQALQHKPDLIHITADENFFLTYQVLRWRNWFAPASKFIFHSWQNILFDRHHFPQPNRLLYDLDTCLERYIYRHATAAVARNQEVVTVLQKRGFGGPIVEIPWGIDVTQFQPNAASEIRQRYQLTGLVFGFVGRMVAEKGVLDLLDAFGLCARQALAEIPLTLFLVGDGPLAATIQARFQKLPANVTVRLVQEIPHTEIAALLGAFDIFVLPSRTTANWKEQFGRALVEAMATEVAVIGSNSGAIPEVIGAAGLIFPEGQVADLALKIQMLAQNSSRRRELGIQARQRVLTYYSWECFAAKTRDLFWQLME